MKGWGIRNYTPPIMDFIKICLALFYITKVLLFEEKESHFGPFPSDSKTVYNENTGHVQPVTLFDWVRRFTINPYEVRGDLWMIDNRKMERWTCPTCLSFWTAIPFTLLNILQRRRVDEQTVIFHFSIAAVSAILNYMVYYVQMRSEEETTVISTDQLSGDVS